MQEQKTKRGRRSRPTKFFLKAPEGRYKNYRICWYNKARRQTDGFSLNTTDSQVAETELAKHILEHSTELLKDEPVLSSMNRFYLKRASKLASEETFATAMKDVQRILGSPLVSEMRVQNQMKLIDTYRAEGYADGTILRRLSCIWASMRYAAEFEHLSPTIIPARLGNKRWDVKEGKKKRLLSLQEVALLLDAACSKVKHYPIPRLCPPSPPYLNFGVRWRDPTSGYDHRKSLETADPEQAQVKYQLLLEQLKREHLDASYIEYGWEWRYLVTMLGTGGRSRAVADVRGVQVEFEPGILHLNPPGRVQTSKYRPTVPMAATLKEWMGVWVADPLTPSGHVTGFKGRPLRNARYLFERLSRQAGFEVGPHMIRHFVSTWLARSPLVASTWERDMFMGWQRSEGSAMGSVYNHYDPRYLRGASQAIQALFEALAPHTIGDLLRRGFDDQPLPEEAWRDAPSMSVARNRNCVALLPPRVAAIPQSAQH